MSLLTDQDYFLQALRLAFLRLDAPLAASSTSHLVHSTPGYALSQYAIQAGLTEEGQDDFKLSSSPGAIPPASSSSALPSAAAGEPNRDGYSRTDRRHRMKQPDGNDQGPGNGGAKGLRHHETIVGRKGAPMSSSILRTKGKVSDWRPKPHHLGTGAGPGEEGSSPATVGSGQDQDPQAGTSSSFLAAPAARPAGAGYSYPSTSENGVVGVPSEASTLVPGAVSTMGVKHRVQPPDLVFDGADASSNADRGNEEGRSYDDEDEEEDSEYDAASDTDKEISQPLLYTVNGERPVLGLENRSLSDALAEANQPAFSPTDSHHGSSNASISASAPSGGRLSRPHREQEQGQPQQQQPSTLLTPDQNGVHAYSMESFDGSLDDAMMDSDEEEDDFEFSLTGRDETSSFSPPFVAGQSLRAGSLIVGGLGLPSIEEAAETSQEGIVPPYGQSTATEREGGEPDGSTVIPSIDPHLSTEDAQLKAAQSARRRARRRVNISGKFPISIDIPLSLEFAEGENGQRTPGVTEANGSGAASPRHRQASSRSMSPASASGGAPRSRPVTPVGTHGTTTPTNSRPMSPVSPLVNSLLRTRSGRTVQTRARSKTDPVSGVSPFRLISPTPSGPSSGQASPLPSPSAQRTRPFVVHSPSSPTIMVNADDSTGTADLVVPPKSPRRPTQHATQRRSTSDGQRPSLPSAPNSDPVVSTTKSSGAAESPTLHSPSTEASAQHADRITSPVPETVIPLTVRSKSAGQIDALKPLALPKLETDAEADVREETRSSPFHATKDTLSPLSSGEVKQPVTPSGVRTVRASPSRSPSKIHDPYVAFPIVKKEVSSTSPPPKVSGLSMLLKTDASAMGDKNTNNPFNEYYGALFAPATASGTGSAAGRRFARRGNAGAGNGNYNVTIYYPFSKSPSRPVKLSLRADLSVEEVLGCALHKYWSEEIKPSLFPDSAGENDEGWEEKEGQDKRRIQVTNWVLRIADEDEDGEVDDDFPAPERSRTAKGFGNCFAVVEATPTQARQNQATDAQIQRRPSRIIRKMQKTAPTPSPSSGNLASLAVPANPATAAASSAVAGGLAGSMYGVSAAGTPSKSSFSMGGSTAPMVYLRIRIPLKGLEAVTTTLHVPNDMYLADVLELTCKKKFLDNPKEWMLVVPDRGIVVPLDRTVESLQGAHNLALARKSTMPGAITATSSARTKAGGLINTNPNASIFKRLSEPPQPKYVSAADLNTNYRSYTVQRKMPMPLGRHERILSLDNDYIHIMPSDTKLVSGTVRTASYHISQIAACKTSRRAPSSFKLVVWRNKDKDVKRYDFEAANGKMATEIAQTINALMQAYRDSIAQEHM